MPLLSILQFGSSGRALVQEIRGFTAIIKMIVFFPLYALNWHFANCKVTCKSLVK